MKYYLKLLIVPIIFLIIYISLFAVWYFVGLPSQEEFSLIVSTWFDRYGPFILFLSAFLEGMLLIGSYFPGAFIVFLGVMIADSIGQAILSVVIATAGLMSAHLTNYFLGRYGWYHILVKLGMREAIEQSKKRMEKYGPIVIPLSYWMPSIGAFTNTAAGIIRLPFNRFLSYSLISSLFWYSLAGFAAYKTGDAIFLIAAGGKGIALVLILVVIWAFVLIKLDHRDRGKTAALDSQ